MVTQWAVRVLLAVAFFTGAAVLTAEQQTLTVAAVQFEVNEDTYRNPQRFERRVSALAEEAAEEGADLVVFPEYINVFLLFDDYSASIRRSDTAQEALARIVGQREDEAGRADTDGAADVNGFDETADADTVLRRIVEDGAAETEDHIVELWGRIARRENVHIVAGTYFAVTTAPVEGGDGPALVNRALVFGPDGDRVHEQDKSFLTPFESDRIGLESSTPGQIDTFEVDEFEVAVTICRDSFFEEWEPRFRDADLWLELRANGEPYTQEVRRRFEGALAERVASTPVPAGVSSGLTGSFLDFLWEGPAYVVDDDGTRVESSEDARGTDIVFSTVRKNDSSD